MKSIREMTQLELGAYINTNLAKKGIAVVLSGGAAVSLYTDNQYRSKDLDLVNVYSVASRKLAEAMAEIGFVQQNRHYGHPESEFIIEFPPGPLTIGDEPAKEILSTHLPTGVLRVISPTDCVKDRLASYYYFGDRQCLQQAILVARTNKIDVGEVKRWSEAEGKIAEFDKISAAFRVKG